MRVAIEGSCWLNARGYGRFARGLVRALAETPHDHDIILVVDRQTAERGDLPSGLAVAVADTDQSPAEAASAKGSRSLRDLYAMSRALSSAHAEMVFFPSVYTWTPVFSREKVLLGVHDVIAEDYPDLVFPDKKSRFLWRLKSALAQAQADAFLTVSRYAREGIVRQFGHPIHRIHVVEEAPDPVFRPLAKDQVDSNLLRRMGIGAETRFFVYLGGINPHKNLGALVECMMELRAMPAFADVQLVIVGELEREIFTPGVAMLREKIKKLAADDAVILAGYLSDEEVCQIINLSMALVLPSFSEGFGLPAVEAAACGRPVIATRNSPLPDLLEGGGIFIDPTDPGNLLAALLRIASDEERREEMGKMNLKLAKGLTWRRSAAQFLEILETIESTFR